MLEVTPAPRRILQVVNLASRKGFCRHALTSGAPLLPVYIFGQTQLFYTLSGRLQELLQRASRILRVSIIPFVGRSWLSPFIPLQQPLTCVVGRPVNQGAEPIPHPSLAQVDELHAIFCAEIRRCRLSGNVAPCTLVRSSQVTRHWVGRALTTESLAVSAGHRGLHVHRGRTK